MIKLKKKKKYILIKIQKLVFLGFYDILLELGFLHIKENEINDISKIKKDINELFTQLYTNRALLSGNFYLMNKEFALGKLY